MSERLKQKEEGVILFMRVTYFVNLPGENDDSVM